MKLIAKGGNERVREAVVLRRWFEEEKRLAIFYTSPATIRDTAFLVHDFPEAGKQDAQWLYLPALRKVRRIAARDRGKSFLGTDMSYEDMKNETKFAADDYAWETLRREACGDSSCLVVEAKPKTEDIGNDVGYGRVVYWIDPTIWIARKAEYHDTAGRLKKTALLSDIREVEGIWTVHNIDVENHRSGHRTIFRSTEVEYSKEVSEDLFTERALRRGAP